MKFTLPQGRPAVMGILNVTPDSFSDGGNYMSAPEALAAARRMMQEGADLIDVGAESTRPGSKPVLEDEERSRLDLIIPRLQAEGIPFSIDTMKPALARFAISHGACLVNDVSGLRQPQMIEAVAGSDCQVCIMHMQGLPADMQNSPAYPGDDVVGTVCEYLEGQSQLAIAGGIAKERIWLDPGIGFGKTDAHNLSLIKAAAKIVQLGYPVLYGVSRKGVVGRVLSDEPGSMVPIPQRLPGSLACQVYAQLCGVRIIRTHDVRETRAAIRMTQAILGSP